MTDIKKSTGQEIKDFLILQNGYIVIAFTEKIRNSFKSTIEVFSVAGNSLFNYSVQGKVIRQIKDSPDGHHIIALAHSGEKQLESSTFLYLYSLNSNGLSQESSLPMEPFPSLKYGASISFEQLEGEFYVITLVSKKGKHGTQEKPDIVTIGIEEDQLQLINSDYGEYLKWLQNVAVIKTDSNSKISLVGVDKKNLIVIDYNLMKLK